LIEPLALSKPERAVLQILSLFPGAIVIAQSTRDPAIVDANRDAARVLLEDGLISSSEPRVRKVVEYTTRRQRRSRSRPPCEHAMHNGQPPKWFSSLT
ncbi:hypothetical protein ACC807_37640, partial [Rhizobium ruizarguesonis]